jgi:hypothetical protein
MPLNKEARIEKIELIHERAKKDKASLRIEIPWKDELKVMTVCKVPLNQLVYNSLNGRILSNTLSLETQNKKINAEDENDNKLLEDLLWNSEKSKNENTLLDIHNLGQQKIGIITKDGVVIDGNRRLMLLNELKTKRHTKQSRKLTKSYDYFKAVVLPVSRDEDISEIEKLEISYQLGEDQKVDYDPIQLYLKIKKQYATLAQKPYKSDDVDKNAIKTIYSWIGNYKTIEKEKDIEFFLSVMNTMDSYLEYCEYDNIPIALQGREEQFRGLTSWVENFRGEDSKKAFDSYKESDVDDLEVVCFDLIRFRLQNTEFRKIGQGQKENHFFGNKEIWEKFNENHSRFIEEAKDSESNIDYNAQDLESHIKDRDKSFGNKIKEDVEDNMSECESMLRNRRHHNEPSKLIKEAFGKLESVDSRGTSFSKSDTQEQLKNLKNKVDSLLFKNDIFLVLEQSLKLLNNIDIRALSEKDIDARLNLIKEINSVSFKMKKQLGG